MRDYDLGEVSKLVRAVYMGLAMMAFMHLYLGYVRLSFLPSEFLDTVKPLYPSAVPSPHRILFISHS